MPVRSVPFPKLSLTCIDEQTHHIGVPLAGSVGAAALRPEAYRAQRGLESLPQIEARLQPLCACTQRE